MDSDMGEPSIRVASRSEQGRRAANEDACLALTAEELVGGVEGLFIVADGMGGRTSGMIASGTAAAVVRDAFMSAVGSGVQELSEALCGALRAANDAVYQKAISKPELQGMGTTCVAAAIRDGRACVAHMGDSRAYLLRDGELQRLTEDHSFVAEKVRTGEITEEDARKSRFRNVITRAVGLEPDAQPESRSFDLEPGDVLLLCTDGLTIPVSEARIADVLCGSADVEEACDRLVGTALRHGGTDNVTAVVAAYGAGQAVGRPRRRSARSNTSWRVAALVALILGMGIGLLAGRALVPPVVKPPAAEEAVRRPDLAQLAYEEPVSLLYTPLQGSILELDRRGHLHVVDGQGRLMRLDTSGRVIHTFAGRDFLKRSVETNAPSSATDRQGNLYIADPPGKRIVKFRADGLFLTSVGEGHLSAPQALAVDDEGSIYVIDAGRLKAIRPKTSEPATAEEPR